MAKHLSVDFLTNRLLIWALVVLEEGKMGPTKKKKRERERTAEAGNLAGIGQRGQVHCHRVRFALECRV